MLLVRTLKQRFSGVRLSGVRLSLHYEQRKWMSGAVLILPSTSASSIICVLLGPKKAHLLEADKERERHLVRVKMQPSVSCFVRCIMQGTEGRC